MNRFYLTILAGLTIISAVAAAPVERTIINGEDVPLRFVFVPRSDLPLIGGGHDESPDRSDAIALLSDHATDLHPIAPGGMWRIAVDPGVVVGVFGGGGGASSLRNRLVYLNVESGVDPVTVTIEDAPFSATDGTAEAWEIPGNPEPVTLDGLDEEWRALEPIYRHGAMEPPIRIEHAGRGVEMPVEEAVTWRVGGTGVHRITALLGERWWYLSIVATDPVAAGTFYHARLFPDRSVPSSAGQVVIPVEGRSGPVVFYDPAGRVTLVGQYVRRGDFLEAAIDRDTFEEMMPSAFDGDWSVDIASSASVAGIAGAREHFGVATIFLRDIPRDAPSE